MPCVGTLAGRVTIGSDEGMAMTILKSSTALDLALDKYVMSLRRAFPAEPWLAVKHYAERAWFAADLPEVPWGQVESRVKATWDKADAAALHGPGSRDCDLRPKKNHRFVSVSGTHQPGSVAEHALCDAVAVDQYEEWSVGRRALQDDIWARRQASPAPRSDYGQHG